ncbi:MAG TPA: ankyrin repeat domain-containing protein [Acidobacteriaceae bacterium]|nr:ankyrin repeat domain-containing protein [Acidobacteriaceae bacterium]
MGTFVFDLIRRGKSKELAEQIEAQPELAQARDAQGVSALLWSVYAGQTAMRDLIRGRVPELDLFEAAALGDPEQLQTLIAADPEAVRQFSGDGWTALHLAAAFGGPEAVRLLLAQGASVQAVSRNPQKNQPLHAALALGQETAAIRLLLDAGADANARQAGGFTPLHSAAAAGKGEAAALLLERGADPGLADDQGKRPADYARERGHGAVAEMLESATRAVPGA